MDAWDKVIEKTIDVEAKASLQLSSETREIDPKYPKNRPLVKKDKNKTYWEHHKEASNKDKDKVKSHNSSSAD